MGFLLNEKQFINDNIFRYEQRMNSQYSRFLDKVPTFVVYYHINNIESTTDTGFLGVERVIGPNSPIKFNKILDLPMYGLDSILLALGDEEQGLDTNYDGELIVLPNTIKPYPNDCFTITYLNNDYLFMVTEVSYDTIKSNNYYKVSFTIRSLSPQVKQELELQIDEKYNCILTNIGTEDKCLIKEEDYSLLLKINDLYKDLSNKYKMLFYNVRYNNFIFQSSGELRIYDKFLANFINKNNLFNERFNYETIMLSDEDPYTQFELDYEKSIYRTIEKIDKSKVKPILYNLIAIGYSASTFNMWRDVSVRSVRFNNPTGTQEVYINQQLIDCIQNGTNFENESIAYSIIVAHFNNTITSPYSFDLEKISNYDYMDYDFESFILVPIILYIIKYHYSKFMSSKP